MPGWFGSDAKKSSAENRSCFKARENASTGSFVERNPASAVSNGQSRDRAALCRARATSVSARARTTAGDSPAASAAASRAVRGASAAAAETARSRIRAFIELDYMSM